MKRTLAVGALAVLAGCDLCAPPQPDGGSCTSDLECTDGGAGACIAGQCQPLEALLKELTVVVQPGSPLLAPQQFQGEDGTSTLPLSLVLQQPQVWNGIFPLPASCQLWDSAPQAALPVTFQFSPLLPPVAPYVTPFSFTTDSDGYFNFPLPAGVAFQAQITTAVPCAPMILKPVNPSPGPAAPIGIILGPWYAPDNVLTVAGTVSDPNGSGVTASVRVLGAQGAYAGVPLSRAVTTTSTGAFVIPVAEPLVLAQPGADAGSCAPPPAETSCDGRNCAVPPSCALFTLEVGPTTQSSIPTAQFSIAARVSAGPGAGPVASLDGPDGRGIRLPVGPSQLVQITGSVVQGPGATPLASATVSIACQAPDGGDDCGGGVSFRATTLSAANFPQGGFTLRAPPNGNYVVTATPPPGLGLAPVSRPISVGQADVNSLTLPVPNGFQLSGTVLDPTGANPVGGEVQVLSLPGEALAGEALIQSDGTFQLSLPPGYYIVTLLPDPSTGFPERSEPINLQGDLVLTRTLFPPGRLRGGVLLELVDGGTNLPVSNASVTFYFSTGLQAFQQFGNIPLPVAQGLTDAQGQFSMAAPSSTPLSQ